MAEKPDNGANIFRQQLQKSVLRKIIMLLAVGSILFIAGFFIITYATNENNAVKNLEMLESVYRSLYERNQEFLLDEDILQTSRDILLGEGSPKQMETIFHRFDSVGEVRNEMILSDHNGEILFTTYTEKDFTSYLINYNSAVCYNAGNSPEKEIYNAVYYDAGHYADYMFVKAIRSEEEILGYITLFLSGEDWNFYLSQRNFDGVITDMRANVMYCSRAKLADKVNKFYGFEGRLGYYGEDRYWVVSRELPEYGVKIYSLIYYPQNSAFYIGIAVIAVMGIFWYKIANWMAASMADNNAQRIGKLVNEIRVIQKGAHDYRINMGTEDEFAEVAHRINRMLDSIQELNQRNTELLWLNNSMEVNQLMAQINPHFLYNTLETIRNLVVQDGKKADEMILKLTQLLRYSINHTSKDVHLEEDMGYIKSYLDIQTCRFGDRFRYDINIEEDCYKCMVPKLVLQPVIENSLKYGFFKKMDIHVAITGEYKDSVLYLTVRDNGMGMAEDDFIQLKQSLSQVYNESESYGLHNISRRLFLQYGENSGLKIENQEGSGFTVTIMIVQNQEERGVTCTVF